MIGKLFAKRDTVPIFPLGTVLFPGGILPLRIFEVRYVEMPRHASRRERRSACA